MITQDSLAVRGTDEIGDEFGAVVEAADVDQDGYDDLIVAAPREDDGAGRVTVIRGWRDGYAHDGGSAFDQSYPSVPGEAKPGLEFGSTLVGPALHARQAARRDHGRARGSVRRTT